MKKYIAIIFLLSLVGFKKSDKGYFQHSINRKSFFQDTIPKAIPSAIPVQQKPPHKTVVTVTVEPKFSYTNYSWDDYLKENIHRKILIKNGAPSGIYTFSFSFIIAKDGKITNINFIDIPTPDYEMKNEISRVLLRGSFQIPAIQNGKPVDYPEQKKTIHFIVKENRVDISFE